MSRVLQSCTLVAEKASIKIDLNCAKVLATQIHETIVTNCVSCENFSRVPVHPQEKNDATVDWIFVVDSLNFCFWCHNNRHWSVSWRGEKYTGYFALCAAIMRAIEAGVDLTKTDVCSNLTYEQFCYLLRGDDNTELLLMEERYQCLMESARVLAEKFEGSFVNCIRESNQSAQKLLDIIVSNFSHFRDEAKYGDIDVYFYKRAQIVVGDIYQCFEGKGLGEFNDIDTITMFADYRVPQVLSYFGVLQYPDSLLSKLIDGVTLENGSPEEVEIRATSIVAVSKINDFVQDLLVASDNNVHKCNSILVDQYLWTYRRDKARELKNELIYTMETRVEKRMDEMKIEIQKIKDNQKAIDEIISDWKNLISL